MSDFTLQATFGGISVTLYESISHVITVGTSTILNYSCDDIVISGSGTFDYNSYNFVGVSASGQYSQEIINTFSNCTVSRFFDMYGTDYDSNNNWLECSIHVTGSIVDIPKILLQGTKLRQLVTYVDIQCYSLADGTDYSYGALSGLSSESSIASIGTSNCIVNIECNYIGNFTLADSCIHECNVDAQSFGHHVFARSQVTLVDIRNDIIIPMYSFYLCQNLTQFNTKKICNNTYINYVKDIELDTSEQYGDTRSGYNFYGCNSIDTFMLEDGINLTRYDNAFATYRSPYKQTTVYTNDQNIRNFDWARWYSRTVTFDDIPVCGKIWNIVNEGSILGFDPMPNYNPPIQDPDVIYMFHGGHLIRFKLVLPSDPLASNVYIKHNGVLMCLANN